MDRLHTLARAHLPLLIAAVLLTAFIQAPLFLFPVFQGAAYQGINISHYGSDEHYYLLRAASIARDGSPSNPVLEEGKRDSIDHTFSYAEKIFIKPIQWLGLLDMVSIVTLVNTVNTIGIFVLVLLIYAFVLQLSRDRRIAFAIAIFVIGGYSIVYNKGLFYDDFNVYGRMVFPLMSSLFFFAYLNFLTLCLRTGRRIYMAAAGASFGALFYLYYFAWSFSLAATTGLALWYLMRKNVVQATRAVVVLGIGVALGAYNLSRIFTYFASPEGKQSSYFAWTLHTHAPVFSLISVVTLVIVGYFFYKTRNGNEDTFIALAFSFIGAGIVALNEQIATGVLVQYGHYYWYFIVPLSIIISAYCVWRLLPKETYKTAFVVLLAGSAFVNTAVGQYRSYFQTLEAKEYEQHFGPALEVLKADSSSSVVLAASDRNASLVPIYTQHVLFWYTQALEGGVPVERLKEALFTYVYLSKEGRENFKSLLSTELAKGIQGGMYASLFTTLEGLRSGLDYYVYRDKAAGHNPELLAERAKLLDALLAEYRVFSADPQNIRDILRKRHVTYILWDRNRYPDWDVSFLPAVLIQEKDGIALYSVF